MSVTDTFAKDPKAALREQLKNETAVMLGVEGVTDFMKPMSAKPDVDADVVWFFTDRRSDTFGNLPGSPNAHICISDSQNKFWADIKGSIQTTENCEAVASNWSADIEAWYEKGREDPNMQLMAFTPEVAEVSVATSNPIKFSWETVKAILGDQDQPDISDTKKVTYV